MNLSNPTAGPSSPRITRSTGRIPLAALPLAPFAGPSLAPPSPLSMPHKRSAPGSGSPSGSGGAGGSGSRKVSRTKGDSVRSGLGSGRRGDSEITPKVKERLERDDLGVGRSPARRLFVGPSSGEVIRSGISGTSLFPQPLQLADPQSQSPSPFLAPSPPLSPRSRTPTSLPTVETGENGVQRNIHDPGFPIHLDLLGVGVGLGTPDSKRNTSAPALSAPSSPSTTWSRYEDQENVPPLQSGRSTPGSPGSLRKKGTASSSGASSRSGASGSCKSGSSAYEEEDTVLPDASRSGGGGGALGLGRSSRTGRSKLAQMMRMRGASGDYAPDVDTEPESEGEGEELTPGKKGADPRGKERLVGEGDGL